MYSSIVVGTNGSPTAESRTRTSDRARERFGGAAARRERLRARPRRRVRAAPRPAEDFQAPSDFKADAVLERALDRTRRGRLEVEQHAPKGDAGARRSSAVAERGAAPT